MSKRARVFVGQAREYLFDAFERPPLVFDAAAEGLTARDDAMATASLVDMGVSVLARAFVSMRDSFGKHVKAEREARNLEAGDLIDCAWSSEQAMRRAQR